MAKRLTVREQLERREQAAVRDMGQKYARAAHYMEQARRAHAKGDFGLEREWTIGAALSETAAERAREDRLRIGQAIQAERVRSITARFAGR